MATNPRKDPTKVADELVDALNRGDWERLRAQVTQDIVYQETGTGQRVQGVDAYLQLCQGWKQVFADVRGTVNMGRHAHRSAGGSGGHGSSDWQASVGAWNHVVHG